MEKSLLSVSEFEDFILGSEDEIQVKREMVKKVVDVFNDVRIDMEVEQMYDASEYLRSGFWINGLKPKMTPSVCEPFKRAKGTAGRDKSNPTLYYPDLLIVHAIFADVPSADSTMKNLLTLFVDHWQVALRLRTPSFPKIDNKDRQWTLYCGKGAKSEKSRSEYIHYANNWASKTPLEEAAEDQVSEVDEDEVSHDQAVERFDDLSQANAEYQKLLQERGYWGAEWKRQVNRIIRYKGENKRLRDELNGLHHQADMMADGEKDEMTSKIQVQKTQIEKLEQSLRNETQAKEGAERKLADAVAQVKSLKAEVNRINKLEQDKQTLEQQNSNLTGQVEDLKTADMIIRAAIKAEIERLRNLAFPLSADDIGPKGKRQNDGNGIDNRGDKRQRSDSLSSHDSRWPSMTKFVDSTTKPTESRADFIIKPQSKLNSTVKPTKSWRKGST
ncbi:hypothetical protein NM208_g9364 [Fusarium decemcellulare]|uniref:Uncharacterized protein n=1 Tax=Fusarium decemcellulare TaxID=57161 RepID=A0ACC1S1U2_9HYPO|nr:hypothetical protein NM208_g9364 [Fusarium decemcellulare]